MCETITDEFSNRHSHESLKRQEDRQEIREPKDSHLSLRCNLFFRLYLHVTVNGLILFLWSFTLPQTSAIVFIAVRSGSLCCNRTSTQLHRCRGWHGYSRHLNVTTFLISTFRIMGLSCGAKVLIGVALPRWRKCDLHNWAL